MITIDNSSVDVLVKATKDGLVFIMKNTLPAVAVENKVTGTTKMKRGKYTRKFDQNGVKKWLKRITKTGNVSYYRNPAWSGDEVETKSAVANLGQPQETEIF